jgi:hypothetical protein
MQEKNEFPEQYSEFQNKDPKPTNQNPSPKGIFANIRGLTRLLIGGLVIGSDKLSEGVNEWDPLDKPNVESHSSAILVPDDIKERNNIQDHKPIIIDQEQDSNADQIRYMLVGLLFRSQDKLEESINRIDKTTRNISKVSNTILSPITNSFIGKPFKKGFEYLVSRGEDQVNDWIMLGKTEEIQSKKMIENAALDQVDSAFYYLSENEDVQEMIQGQSMTLAGEIIEEIRERAVSADNLIEGTLRTMLRMKSRAELPGPPPEVMERVKHPHKGKIG